MKFFLGKKQKHTHKYTFFDLIGSKSILIEKRPEAEQSGASGVGCQVSSHIWYLLAVFWGKSLIPQFPDL